MLLNRLYFKNRYFLSELKNKEKNVRNTRTNGQFRFSLITIIIIIMLPTENFTLTKMKQHKISCLIMYLKVKIGLVTIDLQI